MKHFFTTVAFFLIASAAIGVEVDLFAYPARCGLNNGQISASAFGGIPPYAFAWSNGATSAAINNLAPGDYTVTVTDGLSNTAQATATVIAVFAMGDGGSAIQVQPDCQGMCTGVALAQRPYGGTLPLTYPLGVFESGIDQLTIMGLCGPSFGTITVYDANNCPGEIDVNGVIIPAEPSLITVLSTTPVCEGQETGTMTILMDGPFASVMDVIRVGGGYVQQHYPAWNVPYTITDLPAGDYQLVSSILGTGGAGGPLCSATYTGSVPQVSGPCGSISGRVYHDADQDCVFNGFDQPLPNKVLEILPGPAYAITAWDGTYSSGSALGDYTIGQSLVNETQLCPSADPQSYTLDTDQPLAVVDFANLSTLPHDLSVQLWTSAARPGFQTQVWVNVYNTSAFPSGNVAIDLAFDPVLSNPQPIDGHWDLGVIPPFSSFFRSFQALVPADINLLGTELNYAVNVENTVTEPVTANNSTALAVTITGSYDPNDKQGFTSSRTSSNQYFLDQDEHIDYTVRFQNTGTAAAETVVIRDELDTDLDITSLQILGASHDFVPSFGEGRELVFTFNDINLPDSATDPLGSQGFVSFRITTKDDIVVGDVLENAAGIYFDFNPPIITNTTSHVVEMSTAIVEAQVSTPHVTPNPAMDLLRVTVEGTSASVQVFAMDGRTMKVPVTRRFNGWDLDVHNLDPGTYIVRTEYGSERFVKR